MELYRAAVDASRNQKDQMAALQAIMGESEYDRLEAGVAAGITPEQYVAAKEAVKAVDDNGSATPKEAPALMPSRPLSAKGFRVMPCMSAPALARPAPTRRSPIVRGRRSSTTAICW